MASQELSSQLDSTPALADDSQSKGLEKIYVCRLVSYDETRSGATVRHSSKFRDLGLLVILITYSDP